MSSGGGAGQVSLVRGGRGDDEQGGNGGEGCWRAGGRGGAGCGAHWAPYHRSSGIRIKFLRDSHRIDLLADSVLTFAVTSIEFGED